MGFWSGSQSTVTPSAPPTPSSGGGSFWSGDSGNTQATDTPQPDARSSSFWSSQPASAGDDISRFMEAIGKRESSGDYSVMGKKTSSGDQAYGKYQVMGKNVPTWTQQYLGKKMTPEQFLGDTKAQDDLARSRFQELYKKYGNWEDVASVWFTGKPAKQSATAKDVNGTTGEQYVNDVMKIYGPTAMSTQAVPDAGTPNITPVSFLQGAARSMEETGQTLAYAPYSLLTGQAAPEVPVTPETKELYKILYGSEEPIKPLATKAAESESSLKNSGNPLLAKVATPLAVFGATLGGTADVFLGGEGSAAEATLKAIAKEKDVGAVEGMLVNIGVQKDLAKNAAPKFALELNTAKDVRAGLDHLAQVQATTKFVGETAKSVAGEVPKGADTIVSRFVKETNGNGGATISLHGDTPTEGYVFAPSKATETRVAGQITEDQVREFVNKFADQLSQEGAHIGSEVVNGETILDVSRVLVDKERALAEAADAAQERIYGIKEKQSFDTSYKAETSGGNPEDRRQIQGPNNERTPSPIEKGGNAEGQVSEVSTAKQEVLAANRGEVKIPENGKEAQGAAKGFSAAGEAPKASEKGGLPKSTPEQREAPLQKEEATPPGSPPKPPSPPARIGSSGKPLPPPEDVVKRLQKALPDLAKKERQQAKIYHETRSQQAAKLEALGKKIPGEAGYHAQLGALKGELPRVKGLKDVISQNDIESLFNHIQEHPALSPFDKVNTKGAIIKILNGEAPTKGELALLQKTFPSDFVKAILDNQGLLTKAMSLAGEVINLPRALMASFDVSAPFRQGLFLSGRGDFWKDMPEMLKMFGSEENFKAFNESLVKDPLYDVMHDSGLAMTSLETGSVELAGHEEKFMSNLAERIPGIGVGVRASDRAYTGFLTKLRTDVFKDLYGRAKELGIHDREGFTDSLATYINTASGRGNLGMFNRAAVLLNGLFFSPRLLFSRLNLLNPYFYYKLDPFVRKEALKDLVKVGGGISTITSLAALSGRATVSIDPTNADFGKIKFGDTRIDLAGGFLQSIRLFAQLVEGKVTSSISGRTITLGEGYKPLTRLDILQRFFEAKEAPVASFITSLIRGQDNLGRPFNAPAEVVNRAIPIGVQDMWDLYQDGHLKDLWWLPPVSAFGVGSQTYGKVQLETGQNKLGQPSVEVGPTPSIGEVVTAPLNHPALQPTSSFDAATYYDSLKTMPKEQAATIFDTISKENPNLAKKIADAANQQKAGMTPHDLDIQNMGVADGSRALYLYHTLQSMKTTDEKIKFWDDYAKKKIITPDVAQQISYLMKKGQK